VNTDGFCGVSLFLKHIDFSLNLNYKYSISYWWGQCQVFFETIFPFAINHLRTTGGIVSSAHHKILVLTPFGDFLKSRTSEKLSGITVFLEPTLGNNRIELALPILLGTIPLQHRIEKE
tara:strand:- start:105 stop:461 length:357 start_codon:yes stop_codon:yes gene_type:complete